MKTQTIAHHRAKIEQHLNCIECLAKPAVTVSDTHILVAGILWEKELLKATKERKGVWYKDETEAWYFDWQNALSEAKAQGKKVPMASQFMQLEERTTHKWVERGNQKGMLFLDKDNGNELFWPALGLVDPDSGALGNVAGYGYSWSASPYADATYARYLYFSSTNVEPVSGYSRSYGFPVRCVKE